MSPPNLSMGRTRFPLLAMVLVLAGATGCLIIPANYHVTGSRRNVESSSTNSFQIGITTRRDVLLELGEPDFVSSDEQRLGYAWSKVKAILIVASYGGGGSAEFVRSYVLETSFDANDRLVQTRMLKAWGDAIPTTDLAR